MAFGIEVTQANGKKILTQTMPGGRVYVGQVNQAAQVTGTVTVITFDKVPGGNYLRVLQVDQARHTFVVGTNASGHATITLTATSAGRTVVTSSTRLFVFATQTIEPTYGIQLTNDAGERTTSTVYACPEFLGKITFSATPTVTRFIATPYTEYSHSVLSSLGVGRTRLILWNLPENSGDCWFAGSSLIPATNIAASYSVTATIIRPSTTTTQMPEAFIFALDGLTESSGIVNTYGLRIYDEGTPPNQKLLFDAGLDHMIIKGYENTVDYPNITGVVNEYPGLANMSNVPVFLMPSYSKEIASSYKSPGFQSVTGFLGVMKRDANTIYTKLVVRRTYQDDAYIPVGTYDYGVQNDLLQLVVNGSDYGATSAGLLLAVAKSSGTAYCSFNGSGTSNTVTCQSASTWSSVISGGNANAKNYSWSIVSNSGGLSISGSATGSACTVVKTASAPVGSSATFSCVLRCTVSQVDSSTVYQDTTVVHTHADDYYQNTGWQPGEGGA